MILAGVVAEERVGGGPAITFQQFVGATQSGSVATSPLTGVHAGSLLLAFFQCANITVNSITDSQGNTWTILQNHAATEVGAPFNIVSAWAIAGSSGACTVSFNLSASGGAVVFGGAGEWAGAWTATPIVTSAWRDVNTGNPCTVGAMSGTHDLAVLFGSLYTTGCSWSASSGFTMRTTGSGNVIGVCDSISHVAGSASPSMTLSVNQNTFALGVMATL
jgi:hypothetical protein